MSLLNRHADRSDALRTDLYQLTMAAAYFQNGMTHRASFEMFNRKLLPGRGYHLAAGLELALDYLENLSFSERDIDALRTVAAGVNACRRDDRAIILITHYQRLLDNIKPDYVHVMHQGQIVRSGGPDKEANE